MSLLKFIDRKLAFKEQINYVKSYLFFGAPLGYIFYESLKYFFDPKYTFSFGNLIVTIIVDLLFASPLLINYYKHTKKYNRMHKKIQENPKKRVKAIFNYREFIKGESYEIQCDILMNNNENEYVLDKNGYNWCFLKDNINKFDLDDIKEERLKKLKRLSKLWKN